MLTRFRPSSRGFGWPQRLERRRIAQSTRSRRQETHYETLQIPSSATASEVKKAFYSLSKSCHPDHHPDDPKASNRFITLSTAYSILSTPSTRASYDSTLARESEAEPVPRGTYSSTNPAGGRSPSGLSRRRAQFRGPPPSFYRNGGWGAYAEKRKDSHHESRTSPESKQDSDLNQTYEFRTSSFGTGYTNYEYKFEDGVRYFNREQHLKTQENHRRRMQTRGKGGIDGTGEERPVGLLESFLKVAGILTVGIFLPLSLLGTVPDIRRDM